MSDRELLELAAKAAGYSPAVVTDDGVVFLRGVRVKWSPLTDDGDALRLAAALRLSIHPGKHKGDGCTVETQRSGIAGCTAFYDDKANQMRQAIVRAAAEIGRAMP
jgi:hypothetical protein